MNPRPPRNYDWFGYCVWFGFGMIYGGAVDFILHFALHTAEMGGWQVFGLFSACCLAGGFWWGRKHRRRWEQENAAGAMVAAVFKNRD